MFGEFLLVAMMTVAASGAGTQTASSGGVQDLNSVGTEVIQSLGAKPTKCLAHLREFGSLTRGVCGRLPADLRDRPTLVKTRIESVLDPRPAPDLPEELGWDDHGYFHGRVFYQGKVPVAVQFFTGSLNGAPKGFVMVEYPQQFDNCRALQPTLTLDESTPWTPPVRIDKTPAELPKFKLGIPGTTVLLEIIVSEDGTVSDVCQQGSDPWVPDFTKEDMEVVRKWRFRPAMQGGKPIDARILYAIQFGEGPWKHY